MEPRFVYVVLYGFDYEGSEIIGIYQREDDAIAAQKVFFETYTVVPDWTRVEKIEVK